MQPIFLEPVYKDYIWGGTKLKEKLGKTSPYDKTAESWEISANKNGITNIKNGEYVRKGLDELFLNKSIKTQIFGKKCENLERFPTLIKFIDAKDNLSIQVHPNDEYAKTVENDIGKSEMWYIIDCEENSKIVCGLNDKARNKSTEEILKNANIEEYLNYVSVKRGDSIYIPSGTLHAILSNILICEIQQNSDLTYRVYDWNRVDKDGKSRQLHIEKAIDVINTKNNFKIKHTKEDIDGLQNVIKSEYFCVDKLIVSEDKPFISYSNPNSFIAVNIIDGKGSVNEIEIKKGNSFIIPANMGKYEIRGNIKALISYIN